MRALVLMAVAASAAGLAVHSAIASVQHDQHSPGPPATVGQWARGAQLFSGLGDYHRKVSTRSEIAQAYFDQGMRFLWAYNHDEATRSFAKAAEIDPTCASCYWGVALTLGPNYNMPMMAQARASAGWEAVQKAQEHAARSTPVEQALIAALAKRFAGPAPLDPSNVRPLMVTYAGAMRGVAARFPGDVDVQTLFAEALMNTNPWKLWNADGTPGPGTPEIVTVLSKVLAQEPRHPGANHYWIHAIEASPTPDRGLQAAETLGGLMPAAGHLVHMPAHIMQRVGRYGEAAEANRKGAAADLAYLSRTTAPDYYPMYLVHNFQFLGNAAAMQGRSKESMSALRTALQHMPESMLLAMPGFDWSAGYLYDTLIRFGMWDTMLAEPAPSEKLVGQTISYLQSRATALAAKAELTQAKALLEQAERLIGSVAADATQGLNLARPLYEIGQLKAQARSAAAEGQRDQAVALLTRAIALEDALSYNEPSDMFFPVRHLLGAELLRSGRAAEAEGVYRSDLQRNPNNGWALFGLAQALEAQKRGSEAVAVRRQFAQAWREADVELAASAF